MSPAPHDPNAPTVLTIDDLVIYASRAGFKSTALATAVAVAMAETGGHPTAEVLGDLTLQTAKWGPSVGPWQIRSLKADYGTGRERDQVHLTDPAFNARSAYSISNGGRSFKPWTTYNSGAYRQYLTDAQAAATTATGDPQIQGGTPLAAAAAGGGPELPLRIGGRAMTGELGASVIGGRVDFSTSSVSEISVTLQEDAAFSLSRRYHLAMDAILHFGSQPFRVISVACGSNPAGPTSTLRAQPRGVVAMRLGTPAPMRDVSYAGYMRAIATQAGLRFVGEDTGGQLSTVGPNQITDAYSGKQRLETAWEMGQRLADQLGYYAFETGGVFYFGTANFIQLHGRRVIIEPTAASPGFPAGPGELLFMALETPACTATVSKDVPEQRTNLASLDISINTRVARGNGEQLRPAMSALFFGVAPMFAGKPFLVTRVSWDLIDPTSPVTVAAGTLAAKTATEPTMAPDTSSDYLNPLVGNGANTRSALDFVTIALRQVGDAYVYGVEVSLSDPDPHAFDCSELTQWAASQVGVTFVDGSSNQLAAIRRAGTTISVEQAKHTRGALLFHPGHVVISLGDGLHTVEAMGRKYGVVKGSLAGRSWTAAGKIPGMVYA